MNYPNIVTRERGENYIGETLLIELPRKNT